MISIIKHLMAMRGLPRRSPKATGGGDSFIFPNGIYGKFRTRHKIAHGIESEKIG